MQYEADEAFLGGEVERVREEMGAEYVLVRVVGVCLTVGLVGVGLWLEYFSLIFIEERLLTAK